MKLLLDTHAIIWMVHEPGQLSPKARKLITDTGNERLVSFASLWEISIKMSIGKLELPVSVSELGRGLIQESKARLLPLTLGLLDRVARLPFHHRDPFDRLLIAQALELDCTLLTHDAQFSRYEGLSRVW